MNLYEMILLGMFTGFCSYMGSKVARKAEYHIQKRTIRKYFIKLIAKIKRFIS